MKNVFNAADSTSCFRAKLKIDAISRTASLCRSGSITENRMYFGCLDSTSRKPSSLAWCRTLRGNTRFQSTSWASILRWRVFSIHHHSNLHSIVSAKVLTTQFNCWIKKPLSGVNDANAVKLLTLPLESCDEAFVHLRLARLTINKCVCAAQLRNAEHFPFITRCCCATSRTARHIRARAWTGAWPWTRTNRNLLRHYKFHEKNKQ